MPELSAGNNAVNLRIDGNDNKVNVYLGANEHLSAALATELASHRSSHAFRVLFCAPSIRTENPAWQEFSVRVRQALVAKGFEVIDAGDALERQDTDAIFFAEEKLIIEEKCEGLLVLACDYVTLSQLTHLISRVFDHPGKVKKFLVVRNEEITDKEAYFKQGALLAAESLGGVFNLSPAKGLIDHVDDLVKSFSIARGLYRYSR